MRKKIINNFIAGIGLIFYLSSSVIANEIPLCKINPKLLEVIAVIEQHPKKGPGYPYIISFNELEDSKQVQSVLGNELFLDSRTIDCKNSQLCQKITSYIIREQNIENMDLGAYQINYRSHKIPMDYYFSFEQSYIKACKFLETLVDKHGYSWETIARYHSSTPKYNYAYLQRISTVLGEKK